MNYSRETSKENIGDIDVLWVIDNSGSMNKEASHVNINPDIFKSIGQYSVEIKYEKEGL